MEIICYGDSVTRGISFVRGRLRILKENYPAILQKIIGNQGDIVNKGIFNDDSDLLLKRLDKDVLELNPDVVLIHIGGNDCNFHWDQVAENPDNEHQPIVTINQYKSNIKEMIERIKESGAVPILLTLLPIDPKRYYDYLTTIYDKSIAHLIASHGGIGHWHGLYNRSLNQVIKSTDVLSIDIRTAFKETGDLAMLLNDDGIHPSAKGYSVMAESVMRGLQSLKETMK